MRAYVLKLELLALNIYCIFINIFFKHSSLKASGVEDGACVP